ncbi:MAG: hypothetical protein V1873_05605 [Verrucomicrobiota bacterium]
MPGTNRCVATAAAVLVLMGSWSGAFGATNKPSQAVLGLYGKVESFQWKEYDDNDHELLEESGPIFGLGGFIDIPVERSVRAEGLAELFFGSVDYDGQTQEGVPTTTTTDYAGLMGEGRLYRSFPAGRDVTLTPFAGAGGRSWLRKINDGEHGVGKGYEENWITLYALVGVSGQVKVAPKSELFGRAALHLPVFNEVIIDWSSLGGPSDITVNPGKEFGLDLEAGLRVESFMASVFYETLDFSKSDGEAALIGSVPSTVWQPKSEGRMIGLKAGLVF